jgi:deoxyhypusine monooxygenase
MITVDLEDLKKYESVLSDPSANIADRTDSLFCIKAFKEVEAVDALVRSFHAEPKSELLKHEICYCLGQMDKSEEHI